MPLFGRFGFLAAARGFLWKHCEYGIICKRGLEYMQLPGFEPGTLQTSERVLIKAKRFSYDITVVEKYYIEHLVFGTQVGISTNLGTAG